jgi:hypothetical protein
VAFALWDWRRARPAPAPTLVVSERAEVGRSEGPPA